MRGVHWLVGGWKQIKVKNERVIFCFNKQIPKTYNAICNKPFTLNTWPSSVDLKELYLPTQNKSYHRNTKASRIAQENSDEPGKSSTLLTKSQLFILTQNSSVIPGIANASAYLNFFFTYTSTRRRNGEKFY